MDENKKSDLNLYDYIAFPDLQQRVEAKKVFDMEKLLLKRVTNADLLIFNVLAEQYHVWSNHINNFRSHLGMHLLLMYYQYKQNPLDMIDIENFQSARGAHKVLFDTFAEDSSLYLISYFDKHLEMFNDLFHLNEKINRSPFRHKIIEKMEQVDELRALSVEYKAIIDSKSFKEVKEIRNNFVHNKSSSYYGMDVKKYEEGIYVSRNTMGLSTQKTYNAICELIISYEQLCESVNKFIEDHILKSN